MRPLIVAAGTALAVLITGCASVSRVDPGAGGGGSPSDAAVSGSTISASPTGPSATAARDVPPPVGKHAAAKVGDATITCPDDAFVSGNSPGRAPLPSAVAVKAVVRCETVLRVYPGLGEWSVQLAEVADGPGLAAVADELRKPSERTPPNIVCALYLAIMPWFAVVDDHGRVVEPALPTDSCGQFLPSVGRAMAALDFRAVDAVRVAQSRAPESIKTGCDQQWKDMVAFEGARHPEGVKGSSVADLASSPSSVLVCLYGAVAMSGNVGVGTLVKGATITGEAAAALVSEAARTGPLPAGCGQADQFAVIAGGAYVELDGCHRALTSDGRLGSAAPQLLAQVQAALGLS